jgi:hypothetical protein
MAEHNRRSTLSSERITEVDDELTRMESRLIDIAEEIGPESGQPLYRSVNNARASLVHVRWLLQLYSADELLDC